ncbi:hypothetical protein BDZ45DRAFT_698192 [Acephala macrosclerotiorum]|nr:hypothetical protein BDZ45DRAFT_698192 [Acephala macrosclerotiorum]
MEERQADKMEGVEWTPDLEISKQLLHKLWLISTDKPAHRCSTIPICDNCLKKYSFLPGFPNGQAIWKLETLVPHEAFVARDCLAELSSRNEAENWVKDGNTPQLGHLGNKIECILKAGVDTQFLFFSLLPYEIRHKIFAELASTERLIEIVRQYSESPPLPHLNSLCSRTTVILGDVDDDHQETHHHHFFQTSDRSRASPACFQLCTLSRSVAIQGSTWLCFDSLDPNSPAALRRPRCFWYNPKTCIVLFWLKACNTTLVQFCADTHKWNVDVPRVAFKLNPYCCDFSQVYDSENAEYSIFDGRHPDPGFQAIEILHGIDAEEFPDHSPASRRNCTMPALPGQRKHVFPGCRGFIELLMLTSISSFREPRGGEVDCNTFALNNYDTSTPDYDDSNAFMFLALQEPLIDQRLPLGRLNRTVPRWTEIQPKIKWMQLAQRYPEFPPAWHYRVEQVDTEDMKYIVPGGEDLSQLKILATAAFICVISQDCTFETNGLW